MEPTNNPTQQFKILKELIMETSFIYMEYFELWQGNELIGEVEWHVKIWELYDFTIKEQISKLIIELNLSDYFMGRIDNGHFIDYPDLRGSITVLQDEYLEALRLYTDKPAIDQKIISIKTYVEDMTNTFNQFSRVA